MGGVAPRPAARPVERMEDIERDVDPFEGLDDGLPEEDLSALSPAERRLRQLAEARSALTKAEDAVNVSPEQRARARQIVQRNPESD